MCSFLTSFEAEVAISYSQQREKLDSRSRHLIDQVRSNRLMKKGDGSVKMVIRRR
jgi:hypothetical protein